MSEQYAGQPARRGVIHDLGYRGYTGPRDGTPVLARTLFLTGLRHAYGLGRSGKSKVMPFLLLAMATLPSVIVVGVVVMVGLDSLPISYTGYVGRIQVLISLFAASQAPVLFSRDLRHRSIVLYLARPLPAGLFALMRWLSLLAAVLIFCLVPTMVLYAGAMLAGLDKTDQTLDLVKALALHLLLAAMLAGIAGLISSISLRRGFAVVGSVMVLIIASGVVTAVQAIAQAEDAETIGVAVGLLSPWSLHSGLGDAFDAGLAAMTPPEGVWVPAYVAAAVLIAAGCLLGLFARFRKVGSK